MDVIFTKRNKLLEIYFIPKGENFNACEHSLIRAIEMQDWGRETNDGLY